MGTASSVLKCPKGYDPQKFKEICVLFDKLDKDSNMGVSSDELTSIADLHVKNCKFLLEKRLRAERAALERQVFEIKEKCKQDVERVNYDAKVAEQSTTQQSTRIQAAIQQKITIVMLIPIILVFGLIVSVFVISKRESLEQLNNSLSNISNIDNLKQ